MKKIEKYLVIISVVSLLQAFTWPAVTQYLKSEVLSGSQNAVINVASALGWIAVIVYLVTHIVCGIWLFVEARAEKMRTWVWFLFGLTFQLSAVTLFYIYLLFTSARQKPGALIE